MCHGRTELTENPGTGMKVVQKLQKFRYPGILPRVWFCTYPAEHNLVTKVPGTGIYGGLTELTQVAGSRYV